MQTYLTLDGRVLDLSGLTPEQAQFFDRCIAALRANMPWTAFCQIVESLDNPLLRPTGGVITLAVWTDPLFQAASDIEGRLAISQGAPRDPGDTYDRDPLADEWLSVDDAAERKGLTIHELKQAIRRRRVIATPPQPDRRPRLVSANSLTHWTPGSADPTAVGRRAAATRAS